MYTMCTGFLLEYFGCSRKVHYTKGQYTISYSVVLINMIHLLRLDYRAFSTTLFTDPAHVK